MPNQYVRYLADSISKAGNFQVDEWVHLAEWGLCYF